MLISDNGASAEGGSHGSVNENKFFSNVADDLQQNLAALDELVGPKYFNHCAWGGLLPAIRRSDAGNGKPTVAACRIRFWCTDPKASWPRVKYELSSPTPSTWYTVCARRSTAGPNSGRHPIRSAQVAD